MNFEFDNWGWYAGQHDAPGTRTTTVAPSNLSMSDAPGEPRSNWTGVDWVEVPYVVPPAPAEPDPPAMPAPASCSPAQGLIALYVLKAITEQQITDAIAGIQDPVQRYTAQIGYTRATTWERQSPTMQALAGLLALSGEDLDALFVYAAGVRV